MITDEDIHQLHDLLNSGEFFKMLDSFEACDIKTQEQVDRLLELADEILKGEKGNLRDIDNDQTSDGEGDDPKDEDDDDTKE